MSRAQVEEDAFSFVTWRVILLEVEFREDEEMWSGELRLRGWQTCL